MTALSTMTDDRTTTSHHSLITSHCYLKGAADCFNGRGHILGGVGGRQESRLELGGGKAHPSIQHTVKEGGVSAASDPLKIAVVLHRALPKEECPHGAHSVQTAGEMGASIGLLDPFGQHSPPLLQVTVEIGRAHV